MQYELFPMEKPKYKLLSLSSGSNGNCYYLGTSEYGILIDAGIGSRTIRKYLREYGIALETIVAVLITHDHADHMKSVSYFGTKMSIPVYATSSVHDGIARSRYCEERLYGSRREIEKDIPFSIKDIRITAFDVPHDSIENVGYHIEINGQTIVLATDVGRITEKITHYASKANHLIIEANYDEAMLQAGSYPYYLKQRIVSGSGHLSNRLTGEFLADIFCNNLNEIWLCHLSKDNNLPEIAFKTVEEKLCDKGIIVGEHVVLRTLQRGKPSGVKEF
ncbi:MBL fold metallo-hydrolase [Dysgonomonas sp. 216]|uniref:MBL fold metallo-hydrolase n=1 Tax=Dysgonomonas sp. 216 TaxID=2302934 RepID=UPI0013D2C92F|nr:MBL fold metallo-hydrolase [Dysgonomonas sp. 216]NDW18203.1 MBL fold metallo-hydrolase [Dysgonomonas sp. 216]